MPVINKLRVGIRRSARPIEINLSCLKCCFWKVDGGCHYAGGIYFSPKKTEIPNPETSICDHFYINHRKLCEFIHSEIRNMGVLNDFEFPTVWKEPTSTLTSNPNLNNLENVPPDKHCVDCEYCGNVEDNPNHFYCTLYDMTMPSGNGCCTCFEEKNHEQEPSKK